MGLLQNIIDRFGRRLPQKPDGERNGRWPVPATVQSRYSVQSILSDVTPESIRAAFDAASNGYIGQQIELADTVRERDPHIGSLYETRAQQVLSLDWIASAGDDSPSAQKAKESFEAWWREFPRRRLMEILLRAHANQWAIAQVRWDMSGSAWTPVSVREVDCRFLEWPMSDPAVDAEHADIAADVPFIRPVYGLAANQAIELTPGSFVIHACHVRDGRPGADAPIRAIAMWWMFKRLAMIDWARFIEQFGMPYRVIKYKNMSETEVRTLIASLKAAASDMCLAIPIEAEHELMSMASSGTAPQDLFVGVCDRQMAKGIVGSTTIADAAANNDSVSSPVHAGVLRERRDGDASALEETINRDLVKVWSLWNFGPNVAPPRLEAVLGEKPDPAKRLLIWEGAQALNLSVKSKQLYGELGIEMPDDVPEVLVLKAAQAASPFGSGQWLQGNGQEEDDAGTRQRTNAVNEDETGDAEEDDKEDDA